MLIVFPSSPMTFKAGEWLAEQNIAHRIITLPESINYKTGANHALFVEGQNMGEVPMQLSRAHFVVMRVFRNYRLEQDALPDA
jgi:hypothetical protein